MSDRHTAERPNRAEVEPLAPIPDVDNDTADEASVEYSHYRTGLSRHRTKLSEHRTDLSEYRTDLSGDRTELSMNRTGMSIQRTRMSADRTLMSIIRTALSMIGFGFTLNEAFKKAYEAGTIANPTSARTFGLSLIALGVILLIGGIFRHIQFAADLRGRRSSMIDDELIHGHSAYPVSITLITASLLLLIGVLAIMSVVFNWSMLG